MLLLLLMMLRLLSLEKVLIFSDVNIERRSQSVYKVQLLLLLLLPLFIDGVEQIVVVVVVRPGDVFE